MKKKFTYILVSVGICLVVGLLSQFAVQSSIDTWYASLQKSRISPGTWIFGTVMVALYILMGLSAGMVWAKGFHHRWVKTALYHFGFQLLYNTMWSMVFFGLRQPFWAIFIILTLVILVGLTIRWFHVVNKTAAYLLLPYLLWVVVITYLNYRIWELN